jgi:hypothetical protein
MQPDCRFCSTISKANGEDPIGSAGQYDRFLLIETPPPWSGAIWIEPGSMPQGVIDTFQLAWDRGINVRPLAIAPDRAYSTAGFTRVLHFYRPSSCFARFTHQGYLIPPAKLSELVMALLNHPEQLALFQPYQQSGDRVRDLLVCTHGNYDVACSRFGYPIYKTLRQTYARTDLRIWRCSHFGGHQFAPTLLDLPNGHYWGHLEADKLGNLVNRQGAIAELRSFYRGWAGLAKFEQIAEREIWIQEGCNWLRYLKCGETTAISNPDADYPDWAEVRIHFTSPNGERSGIYEARIDVCGQVTTMWNSGDEKWLEPAKQYQVSCLNEIERC